MKVLVTGEAVYFARSYLMHPGTVLGITDIDTVETKTGTPILVTPELVQATNGNLNTIGKMLGLSRERIRQVNQKTFLKIRRRLGREMGG